MITLVLDGLGTATSISIIKGLKEQNEYDFKIIGIDSDSFCAGKAFVDEFEECPLAKDKKFPDFCNKILEKHNPDIWIPIIDYAFPFYADNRNSFLRYGCNLLIGSVSAIQIASSKYNTYVALKDMDIPVPDSWTISNFHTFKGDGEFITKPNLGGRASIGVAYHENYEALEKALNEMVASEKENTIIQKKGYGQEFTADCLSDLDGNFIAAFARKRIETKGGLSIKASAIDETNQKIISGYIKKIAKKLKLPGAYNIQGFIDNESIIFFEINPRFAGSHPLTIKSGLNSIYRILQMTSGKNITTNDIKLRFDIKMARYWQEVFWDKNDDDIHWKNF